MITAISRYNMLAVCWLLPLLAIAIAIFSAGFSPLAAPAARADCHIIDITVNIID